MNVCRVNRNAWNRQGHFSIVCSRPPRVFRLSFNWSSQAFCLWSAFFLMVIFFSPSVLYCIRETLKWFIHLTVSHSSWKWKENGMNNTRTALTLLTLAVAVELSPLSYPIWLTELPRKLRKHPWGLVCVYVQHSGCSGKPTPLSPHLPWTLPTPPSLYHSAIQLCGTTPSGRPLWHICVYVWCFFIEPGLGFKMR